MVRVFVCQRCNELHNGASIAAAMAGRHMMRGGGGDSQARYVIVGEVSYLSGDPVASILFCAALLLSLVA